MSEKVKELLEKQMELLSEQSHKDPFGNLAELGRVMVDIATVLSTDPVVVTQERQERLRVGNLSIEPDSEQWDRILQRFRENTPEHCTCLSKQGLTELGAHRQDT